MKFNYLAVIVPVKWLPQNTEQARAQAWAAVTQLLLPDLGNINFDQTQKIGGALICCVTSDGSNKALEIHSAWHLAMMEGILLPDCGLYYLEQRRSVINPELEKTVAAHPGDYALCAVTLEMEATT